MNIQEKPPLVPTPEEKYQLLKEMAEVTNIQWLTDSLERAKIAAKAASKKCPDFIRPERGPKDVQGYREYMDLYTQAYSAYLNSNEYKEWLSFQEQCKEEMSRLYDTTVSQANTDAV